MAIFLGLNGKKIRATEEEVEWMMIALAAGSVAEEELATWVRGNLVRRTPT